MALTSNPSENPLAKEAPILAPSSRMPDTSMPGNVMIPIPKPAPKPEPISPIISAIFAFPVLFHHFPKGSAIIPSHRISTFPKKSVSCHRSEFTRSSSLRRAVSTCLSTKSIRLSSASSTMGMASVSHSAIPRK